MSSLKLAQKKRKFQIVIFSDDSAYTQFLWPFVESLALDSRFDFVREAERTPSKVKQHADNADLLWFDGFDNNLVELSSAIQLPKARIVCRLRGVEFLNIDTSKCRWEFIDDIIVTNTVTEEVLLDQFDRLKSCCQIHHIPASISVPNCFVSMKRATKNIAYVGPVTAASNAMMLLQWLSDIVSYDPEYKLYIIGDFENLSTQIYFEQIIARLGLQQNIEFNPYAENLGDWYNDKSFYLSPQIQPGDEQQVLRAMSYGLKPLVHAYFGADRIFPETMLFNTSRDLLERLNSTVWSAQSSREFAIERFDLAKNKSMFEALLEPAYAKSSESKVSILIPTFNRSKMLKRLVVDLKKQTYKNIELVVIDDCSEDDTAKVVSELSRSRKDIVYHRNEVNQGNAATMAIAASHATGDYLLVCSDDDQLDESAVEEFVKYAARKNADIVYGDLAVINDKGEQQTVWQYQNYYRNDDLLRDLLYTGWNKIPEVFFIRRELYQSVYTETYARRFVNTYYLGRLKQLKMVYLPLPLYGYTVHSGSTFSNAKGLFDRCKSTQNFFNAIGFKYELPQIFEIPRDRSAVEQIAMGCYALACLLVDHGKKYIEGEIYTGAKFSKKDDLYRLYYYTAYHWLKMARKYVPTDPAFSLLEERIDTHFQPDSFDPVAHGNMPAIYSELPWFAFRPFNNLSQFVAFDMVTMGNSPALSQPEYNIYKEGKAQISVCNHICSSLNELDNTFANNIITVVNIVDNRHLETTFRYLAEKMLFNVQVVNLTSVRIPPLEIIRNVYSMTSEEVTDFRSYLKQLTQLTTTGYYAHSNYQTVS